MDAGRFRLAAAAGTRRVHVPQGRSTDGLSEGRVRAKSVCVGGGGRSHLLARTAPLQTLVLSPR